MDFISSIPDHVDELYLYSDNCTGQNKNHAVLRLFMALTDSGRFKKVVYRLPVRRHSYLPCDRSFGLVKRTLRQHDRYYTVTEIEELILSSSQNNTFKVKCVGIKDVKDFVSL